MTVTEGNPEDVTVGDQPAPENHAVVLNENGSQVQENDPNYEAAKAAQVQDTPQDGE